MAKTLGLSLPASGIILVALASSGGAVGHFVTQFPALAGVLVGLGVCQLIAK